MNYFIHVSLICVDAFSKTFVKNILNDSLFVNTYNTIRNNVFCTCGWSNSS